jgi:tRNA(Ile)-lysidine synthase
VNVPDQVREFLSSLSPQPRGIVVAVSGGADSVALLRSLVEVFPGRLVVAHFNHGLRGLESDADADFVTLLAGSLELECRTIRRTLTGSNLEAAARDARYSWLGSVAESENCDCIATGHTLDDQAETVLFRILRGTGIAGLAGIYPIRTLTPTINVLRPLLFVSRPHIHQYLLSLSQPFRTDSSNLDRRFTRNRIRHDLLPLLQRDYNANVSQHLAALAEQARKWRRRHALRMNRLLARIELPRAGRTVVLSRDATATLSTAALTAVFRAIWEREAWPRLDMGAREYNRLARWCDSPACGIEMPGNIRAIRRERTIVIGPAKE